MSKPGVTQTLIYGGLGLRAGLRKALFEPTPFVRATEPKQRASRFTDELILAVRTMREVERKSYAAIRARFGLTHGQVKNICHYAIRAHLVPEAALAIEPKHFRGRA